MTKPYTECWHMKLNSLDPQRVLEKLDLDRPGLEAAKAAADAGDRPGVLAALLDHYRTRYPLPSRREDPGAEILQTADRIADHIFQWGPYEEAAYGEDVDWAWDPRGDIEWVANIYRFFWALPLARAFAATRDEKCGRAFVELTADWIAKHPLEDWTREHDVYGWKGYPWLDIQTGIRATNLCQAFRSLVHAEAVTPEFLGVLLASVYDHQVKTEAVPMGQVHNKAVFEQRGFVNICNTFPEFADTQRWLKLALERVQEVFLAQTTSDGVQREWSFGYHLGVLRDAVEIRDRMTVAGIEVSDAYLDRIRGLYDYIFAVATPDLGAPMFGDAARSLRESEDRRDWDLYAVLNDATDLLADSKYRARADLDRTQLPDTLSYAFTEAGMYVLRNDWGTDTIHMGLHCSPPAISSHDQPDNGTFELYAYGRWLMPDTGFYTYGHDLEGRAWHRQTSVHQTLTLDGRDSADDPRHLIWHTSPEIDCVAFENRSYEGLAHRRTVWFVGRRLFVLLDEAIGDAAGDLDLHFQLAPGEAQLDLEQKLAHTLFDDANVLVWSDPNGPVEMAEEEGWFAWAYGHRTPRKAFRYRHLGSAPASFVTLLVPYRGTEVPEVGARLVEGFDVGDDRVELEVEALGKKWSVGRDTQSGEGWLCEV